LIKKAVFYYLSQRQKKSRQFFQDLKTKDFRLQLDFKTDFENCCRK